MRYAGAACVIGTNHDLRVIGRIRCVEDAALLQTSAESREVVATHRFEKHFRILVRWRLWSTLNQERATAVETKHRMRSGNRRVKRIQHTEHRY